MEGDKLVIMSLDVSPDFGLVNNVVEEINRVMELKKLKAEYFATVDRGRLSFDDELKFRAHFNEPNKSVTDFVDGFAIFILNNAKTQ